jgi:hypothetical protein
MVLPLAIPIAMAAAQAIPAVAGMFQKNKKTPQERAAESNLNQANDYINLSMSIMKSRGFKMIFYQP